MSSFELFRQKMVEGQVLPHHIRNPHLIWAMRELAREKFVLPSFAKFAYTDMAAPMGDKRFLMQPHVAARLIDAGELTQHQKVLVIGAGTGYSTALLSFSVAHVVGLEVDAELQARAKNNLDSSQQANITWALGPLELGWAEGAPYDVIFIEGAVDAIPAALGAQLAEGGRILACVLRSHGAVTEARCYRKQGQGLSYVSLFDAHVPPLGIGADVT